MWSVDMFGWAGGGLAIVYNIPQLFHVYKTKQVSGLSSCSIALRVVSYLLVMTHCYIRNDEPIFYTTGVGLFQLLLMYGQVCYYGRRPKPDTGVEEESK
jgi:uncharacterized protein with PQ loop repeat